MNKIKAILIIFSTCIVGLCILQMPQCVTPISFVYLSIISVYLGLDVAEMITSTASMKKGEYKEIASHKYIISLICLLFLIGLCALVHAMELQTALTTFISAILVVIGCLIGGLEGNKIATKKGE